MFFRKLLTLLCFLLPCLSISVSEAAAQWTLQRDNAGIKIYQQPTATGYALTRGELIIPASIGAIVTAMEDRKTCQRWVYACKQGYLVEQYSQTQRLDYTMIDSPLLFADRDMYIYSQASFDPQTGRLTIRLSGRENHDQGQDGKVRVKALHGLWQLTKQSPEATRVTYQIHSNPQLPASQFLDEYMVESVFQTLKNLSGLAAATQPRDDLYFPQQ